MSKTYCITGSSGYIGKLLAQKLARDTGNKVIGIDLNQPAGLETIKTYQSDIRDPAILDIFQKEKVEVVVHLAFYTAPEGDAVLAQSVNVDGTRNILAAAAKAPIRRFVLASSAAAYGSHPDNPIPMTEAHSLRPNRYFYYSDHKALQEKLAQELKHEHPEIQLLILRPCVLIGPHINNPTGDSLKQKVLIYIKDKEPPFQLIYEDDAAEAFYLAAVHDAEGIFNIAADGTLTYPELANLINKKIILLPFGLLKVLANIGKWLRLSPVGAKTINFISNPIIIDPAEFNRRFNFTPQYDTIQAMIQFSKTK